MGSAASAAGAGLMGFEHEGGAGQTAGRNLNRSRYFCHNCRRSSYNNESTDVLECSFCHSTFIEHINEEELVDHMQVGAQNELTSDQSRRIVNATLMLRLIENQIRAELQELQARAERGEVESGGGVDMQALLQAQAATAKRLLRVECTLTRPELDNIWLVRCTLDMACSQPACPICSEEFVVYNEFQSKQAGDAGGVGDVEDPAPAANVDVDVDDEPIPLPSEQVAAIKELCASAASRVLSLPCRHIYHRECVLPWLQSKHTCPICRFELTGDLPVLEAVERLAAADVQFKVLMEEEEAYAKARERERAEQAPGKRAAGEEEDAAAEDPDSDRVASESFQRLVERADERRKEYNRGQRAEEAKLGGGAEVSNGEDAGRGMEGKTPARGAGQDAKCAGAKAVAPLDRQRVLHYERLQDFLFTTRSRHDQAELLLDLIVRRRAIDEINFNHDSRRFLADQRLVRAGGSDGDGDAGGRGRREQTHEDIGRDLLDALFRTDRIGAGPGPGVGRGGRIGHALPVQGLVAERGLGQLAEEDDDEDGPTVEAPFRGSGHSSLRGSENSSAYASQRTSPHRLEVFSTEPHIRELFNMMSSSSLMQGHARGIQIFTEDGEELLNEEFRGEGIDDNDNITPMRGAAGAGAYMPRLQAGDDEELALTQQLMRTYRPHVLSRNSDSENSSVSGTNSHNTTVNESLAQFNQQSLLMQGGGDPLAGLAPVSPLRGMAMGQAQVRGGVHRHVLQPDSEEEDEAYLNRSELLGSGMVEHAPVVAAVGSGAGAGRPGGAVAELDVETEDSIRQDIQRNRYSRTYQQWIRGLPADNPYAILWRQVTGGMAPGEGSSGSGTSSSAAARGIGQQSTREVRSSRLLPNESMASVSARMSGFSAAAAPPTNDSSFTQYVYNNPVNRPGRQPQVVTSNNSSAGSSINAELARHRLGNTSLSSNSSSSLSAGAGGTYSSNAAAGSISTRVAAAAAREQYEDMYNEFTAAAVTAINSGSSNTEIANATALLAGAGRSGGRLQVAAGRTTVGAQQSGGMHMQTVTLNRRGQPVNTMGRVAGGTVQPTPTPDVGAAAPVSPSVHDDVD